MASGVDAASQPVQRRVGLWGLTPGDPPGTVLVHAPAKLNLTLSVLARRPDRFHELESLMVAVSLQDTLILRPTQAAGIRLGVRFGGRIGGTAGAALRRDVPADGRNLVVRAAELLAAEAGVSGGLEIELVKEIPSGAGLGGGSSDAAAVRRPARSRRSAPGSAPPRRAWSANRSAPPGRTGRQAGERCALVLR